MKSNISINTDDHFPYLGNGIQFNEHLFGLEFDANLIQQTSELIWQPNSTLPYSTLKKLPAPYNILSDIALEMTVHNNSKIGLIGQNVLFDEVKLIDDGLMDKFILDVQNHIANPTKESAELIAAVIRIVGTAKKLPLGIDKAKYPETRNRPRAVTQYLSAVATKYDLQLETLEGEVDEFMSSNMFDAAGRLSLSSTSTSFRIQVHNEDNQIFQ